MPRKVICLNCARVMEGDAFKDENKYGAETCCVFPRTRMTHAQTNAGGLEDAMVTAGKCDQVKRKFQ
jgi:hypothetical protein